MRSAMNSDKAGQSAPQQSVLTAIVIEDCQDIREGLQMLIGGTPGYRCAGAFRSMEEALAQITDQTVRVILVDIGLPGMSGIEGIPLLRARFPDAAVLVLSVYEDDERIFAALCAGACGYLLKKTPPARLLESLREAVEGGAPMSPEVARKVVTLFREVRPAPYPDHDLTPHELRLVKLFAEGHSYKTAADLLGITVNTVSFHMRRVYEKLHVHSKSEAIAKALRGGLLR